MPSHLADRQLPASSSSYHRDGIFLGTASVESAPQEFVLLHFSPTAYTVLPSLHWQDTLGETYVRCNAITVLSARYGEWCVRTCTLILFMCPEKISRDAKRKLQLFLAAEPLELVAIDILKLLLRTTMRIQLFAITTDKVSKFSHWPLQPKLIRCK